MNASLFVHLARHSLFYRRSSTVAIGLCLCLSAALLFGIFRLQRDAHQSFLRSVNGVDLIVGARTGDVHMLLATVFRVGNHPDTIGWQSVNHLVNRPEVAWAVPMVCGDSHRGHPLIGVGEGFFEYMRYGNIDPLSFAEGQAPDKVFEVAIGASVAQKFRYAVGQSITMSHGGGEFDNETYSHSDRPYTISGILIRTGTVLDQQLIVSLAGYEALHADWVNGRRDANRSLSQARLEMLAIEPERLNAVYVGLKSPVQALSLQHQLRTYAEEPLSAVMPAIALQNLWSVVGNIENSLELLAWGSLLIAAAGLLGAMNATLRERIQEMAILRALGLGPPQIAGLLFGEATLLALVALALGYGAMTLGLLLLAPVMQSQYSIHIQALTPAVSDALVALLVLGASLLASVPIAWRILRTPSAHMLLQR